MGENYSDDISMTDWDRLDVMNDEHIDTSDIPPLDASFFNAAELRLPQPQKVITTTA